MAFCLTNRGIVVLLLAGSAAVACTSADFSARDGDAGAAGKGGSSAGAAGVNTSGGSGGTPAAGHAGTSASGSSGATAGAAQAGSTGQGGSISDGAGGSGADGPGSAGSNETGGSGAETGSGGSGPMGTGGNANGTGGDATSTGGVGSGNGGGGGLPVAGAAYGGAGNAGMSTAGSTNGGGAGKPTIGGCDNELLDNANFDAGPTASWQEDSEWPGLHIVVGANNPDLQAEGVTPFGGDYLGWLGGVPDNQWDYYNVTLTQTVTIPDDTSMLTLTGEYWVKSVEDPTEVYDETYIQLMNDEDVLWLAKHWTNEDVADGWKSFMASTTELGSLRGKTVTFVTYSRTDPNGKTSFFFDDLQLAATCGR